METQNTQQPEQTQAPVAQVPVVEEAQVPVAPVAPVAPKGYYLTEQPTGYAKVIAIGDQAVLADELIVKMANSLRENGLMKD